mmetsp:Transcript_37316/g.116678  ORF Transcript_37316/g.116678 Transcript_37316/m.116678 type:complete len:212 (-) Transcript_37316:205-840(-)
MSMLGMILFALKSTCVGKLTNTSALYWKKLLITLERDDGPKVRKMRVRRVSQRAGALMPSVPASRRLSLEPVSDVFALVSRVMSTAATHSASARFAATRKMTLGKIPSTRVPSSATDVYGSVIMRSWMTPQEMYATCRPMKQNSSTPVLPAPSSSPLAGGAGAAVAAPAPLSPVGDFMSGARDSGSLSPADGPILVDKRELSPGDDVIANP